MIRINSLLLWSLISISFFSCKTQDQNEKTNKYDLNFHVQTEANFYYDILNESTTESEVNGEKSKSFQQTRVGILAKIAPDRNGGTQMNLTYNRFDLASDRNGEKTEIKVSKTDSSDEAGGRVLKRLLGKTLVFSIDKNHHLVSDRVNTIVMNQMIADFAQGDLNTARRLRDQFSQMIGQAFLSEQINTSFASMPDTPVSLGDSWNREQTFSTDLNFKITAKYTFNSVTDSLAEIGLKATFNNTDSTFKVMDYEIGSDIKGEQRGKMLIDLKTGVVMSDESEMTLKGTLQVLGRDVPVDIKIRKSTQLKKI